MNRTVIGLVGELASGKGTVAEYIQKKTHASQARFSQLLLDVLNRLALKTNRENFSALAQALRKTFGKDVIGKALKNDIAHLKETVTLIDGIRIKQDV